MTKSRTVVMRVDREIAEEIRKIQREFYGFGININQSTAANYFIHQKRRNNN